MRNLILILFLLLVQVTTKAQSDFDKINFAVLHYKLMQEKLPQSDLEMYLKAFPSLGDKNIILKEVFRNMLESEDLSYADSLINFWLNDFSTDEINKLNQIVPIADNWMERAWNVVVMSYMGKAYLENVPFIDAYLKVRFNKLEKFPNLPPEKNFSYHLLNPFYQYYSCSKWYLNYPDEFEYFRKMLTDLSMECYQSTSEDDIIQFTDLIKLKTRESNTIYDHYIPMPLEDLIAYSQNNTTSLNHSELCNKEQIDQFLTKSYFVIHDEQIPENLLENLKNYIVQNDIYNSELIYLVLILSKYE